MPFPRIPFSLLLLGCLVSPSWSLLLGTNYEHLVPQACSMENSGIIATYHLSGTRATVKQQLSLMHSQGVDTLRLIIWHMTDIGQYKWGIVPSAGGTLPEPYRQNFIDYLSDVRAAGIKRLTISFAPEAANSPRNSNYDPSKLSENWHFIMDVRALTKKYGPEDSVFDLFNEGAPSDYKTATKALFLAYLSQLYRNYVPMFGKEDVTVSTIGPKSASDQGNRLQNLIDMFKSTGQGQPKWFDMHFLLTREEALYSLRNTDEVLRKNNLSQPIVISETSYNDPEITLAVQQFQKESTRPILELMQWPRRVNTDCLLTPPYSVQAFMPLNPSSPVGPQAEPTAGFRVYPNPWRITVHRGKPILFDGLTPNSSIKIFSLDGRFIRMLSAATESIDWNLKNETNDFVAAGIYLYVVTTPQGAQTRGKLAIIK